LLRSIRVQLNWIRADPANLSEQAAIRSANNIAQHVLTEGNGKDAAGLLLNVCLPGPAVTKPE
jgi:hypothetical protein